MTENDSLPNGLSRAVAEHEDQCELDSGVDTSEPEGEQIHIVVTNYDDDPHPHVEGVFTDEDEADDLMKKCGQVTAPPHPIAWKKVSEEIP